MLESGPIAIDLRQDVEPLADFLRAASRRLVAQHPGRVITGVQIPYFLPGGFVEVEFFDNPDFEVMAGFDGFVQRERFNLPHWGNVHDACCQFPTQTRAITGALIATEPPTPGEWPEALGEVVEAMGEVLVHVVAGGLDPLAPLVRCDPLSVGIYSVGDHTFLWRVTLGRGTAQVEADHD